jgi:hypothetical protein
VSELPREQPPRAPLPPDYVPPLFPRDLTDAVVRFAVGVGVGYLLFHLPSSLWGFLYAAAGAVAIGALMGAVFAVFTGARERRRRANRVRLIEHGRVWTLLIGAACAVLPELVRLIERAVTFNDLPAMISMVVVAAIAPFLVFGDEPDDERAPDA